MTAAEKRLANQVLWQERIQAQASSGKTVVRFCSETAIALSVFYAWKSRLNESKKTPRVSPASTKSFIDLGPVKPPFTQSIIVGDSSLSIRLDLGSGVSLSITRS